MNLKKCYYSNLAIARRPAKTQPQFANQTERQKSILAIIMPIILAGFDIRIRQNEFGNLEIKPMLGDVRLAFVFIPL
jgi:hypothetical protein